VLERGTRDFGGLLSDLRRNEIHAGLRSDRPSAARSPRAGTRRTRRR
jgi:hypothetical protein